MAKRPNNDNFSASDFERPGWRAKQRRMMIKGTDLAHKYSFAAVRNDLVEFCNNGTKKAKIIMMARNFVGPRCAQRTLENLDQIRALDADNPQERQQIITLASSIIKVIANAPKNLRPGDRRRNRVIKSAFDPNFVITPTTNSSAPPKRSLTPHTRKAIIALAKKDGVIPLKIEDQFKVKDQDGRRLRGRDRVTSSTITDSPIAGLTVEELTARTGFREPLRSTTREKTPRGSTIVKLVPAPSAAKLRADVLKHRKRQEARSEKRKQARGRQP